MSVGWPFAHKGLAAADGRVPADPVAVAAVGAALSAADGYRGVRAALRIDRGVARVGNRFVPVDRFREVAFLSVGRAANSMALAALAALGRRLTQGLVIGPDPVAAELPFRGVQVPFSPPASTADGSANAEAIELAQGLGPSDLLLVLLSPGALSALAAPPEGMGATAWAEWLGKARDSGVSGPDLARVVRVLARGAVGGRLIEQLRGPSVATLLVDRGQGAALLGGGPTVPIADAERRQARRALAVGGLDAGLSAPARRSLDDAPAPRRPTTVARPVVVAAPPDALRGAAEAVAERRWKPRLVSAPLGPDAPNAAATFVDAAEALYRADPPASEHRGLAAFLSTNFGTIEGDDERAILPAFLQAAGRRMLRRGATIAAFQTGGATRSDARIAGAVVSASPPGAPLRPLSVAPGVTDVGTIVVALFPTGA